MHVIWQQKPITSQLHNVSCKIVDRLHNSPRVSAGRFDCSRTTVCMLTPYSDQFSGQNVKKPCYFVIGWSYEIGLFEKNAWGHDILIIVQILPQMHAILINQRFVSLIWAGNARGEEEDNRRRLPREPSGIGMMAQRLVKKREDDKILDEWQLAGRVINRLFMIIYLVAVCASIIGIFLFIPGLLTSRPKPPLSEDWLVSSVINRCA